MTSGPQANEGTVSRQDDLGPRSERKERWVAGTVGSSEKASLASGLGNPLGCDVNPWEKKC